MEVKHGRGCVYALEYHIVWCTKYRRKVISGKIESALFKILDDYASKNSLSILEKNSCPDHIHLLVSATPQAYLPKIQQGCMKGVSSRLLFQHFPEIKDKLWGGYLWSPSYFVAAVSYNTEAQIKNYIQSQKEK